jgi:hypothetical protein
MRRDMVKLIYADDFFPPGDAEKYHAVIHGLQFTPHEYGTQVPNFSLIFPGIGELFSNVVGEKLVVDEEVSGVYRKPMFGIHFESFATLTEWCFIVALEQTTFNIYHHLDPKGWKNRYPVYDAKSALDGYQFNYANMIEWDIQTNIILEPNQGVFFRPWMFHSLERGLVQYYRLTRDESDNDDDDE